MSGGWPWLWPFWPNGGTSPSLTGFQTFLQTSVGISANYLPTTSQWTGWAYDQALNLVNPYLQATPGQTGAWSVYATAVYNCATHLLIEMAQDVSYAVSAASWANGLATITLTAASAVLPGDAVAISGVSPVAYDAPPAKPFVVNSVDNTTTIITVPLSPNPGAAAVLAGAALSETYFYQARATFGINRFAPGTVTSASDQGTSSGLIVPEWAHNLTFSDLQFAKTVWGRTYLGLAQRFGTLWGLS